MIRFYLVLTLAFVFLSSPLLAQEWEYDGAIKFSVSNLPKFHEFNNDVKSYKIAEDIDFSSYEGAWSFRTRLRRALKAGPNFAGKYKVMTHGCGTSCQLNWIIDVESGNILNRLSSNAGIEYKLDSRLIILHPPREEYFDYEETVSATFGEIVFYEFITEPREDLIRGDLNKLMSLKPPILTLNDPNYLR